MIQGAVKKFAVVDLAEVRRKKAVSGGGTASAAAPASEPVIGRVARIALEAWGRPIIIVDGELWTYAAGIWTPVEQHDLRAHVHQAARLLNSVGAATLNGAHRWIAEDLALIRRDVLWDRAGVIVGTNAALELETGRMVPHSPEHYATRGVGCAIVPGAECPAWRGFLGAVLPEDCLATVQEWFGAALVRGKTRETTKGLIVIGPSRTGKTQVASIARALIGGKACGLHVRKMSERFGLQPLVHASAWIADDAVSQNETMDAEAYKVVVTGESISVERKGLASLEVRFDIPVLLTMNNLPGVKDSSDAVYNRTLVLPMQVVCEEKDAKPIAEMVIASELSGVLNWAVAGWHRLRERGQFAPPPIMLAASREFKGQNNHFPEFFELCMVVNPDRMILRDDLRDAFNAYMKIDVQARFGWSGKAIAIALKHLVPAVSGEEVNAGRVWYGVAFKEAVLPFMDTEFGKTRRSLQELNMLPPDEIIDRHHPPRKGFF